MKDSYKEITEIITKNADKVLWHQPWFVRGGFKKYSDGTGYSLLNTLLLMAQGETGGEYIGFNSAIAAGGHIKKGEHGKIVYFWKMFESKKENDEEGKPKIIPFLKRCTIFNVETQCEGVPLKFADKKFEHGGVETADKVARDYIERENIKFEQNPACGRAFFRPSENLVQVPPIDCFKLEAEYYSTLYHELTHSTGTKDRLDRLDEKVKLAAFGSEDYSREELVAEMGSAFALNDIGIRDDRAFNNSVAYINGWNKKLKSDPKMIVWAASKAEAAIDFIFNRKKEGKNGNETEN